MEDRWHWASSDGPVEHIRTRCLLGHVYTVPVDGAWLTYAERSADLRDGAPHVDHLPPRRTGARPPHGFGPTTRHG